MIDIRLARENPDAVKAALARTGRRPGRGRPVRSTPTRGPSADWRSDELRARVKDAVAPGGPRPKRAGDDGAPTSWPSREPAGSVTRSARPAPRPRRPRPRCARRCSGLPNLPSEEAPDGARARGQRRAPPVVAGHRRRAREPLLAEHQRVPHWEIGEQLGHPRHRAGGQALGLDVPPLPGNRRSAHPCAHRVRPGPPRRGLLRRSDPRRLVRTETMVSTGHLPKFADDAYHIERDDLWAIPTAEVPLTSMHRDEILDEADLPLRSRRPRACFRREAGSAGRDTRGLLRVHEFDKVELFAYATAEQAPGGARATSCGGPRALLQALELAVPRPRPVRRRSRRLRGPDLRPRGVRARQSSSGSRCRRSAGSATTRLGGPTSATGRAVGAPRCCVHTLNGSALAWARIWAALVETGRQRRRLGGRLPDVPRRPTSEAKTVIPG